MLSFFPNPYPDEILYSVFARYHVRSGNTSPKATLRELFGTAYNTATIDLPSNINALIKNMPIASAYTAENFIVNNTLYPFYAPFLPKERAEAVHKAMLGDNGGNIHTRTGIMASNIEVPKHLRYCPKCFIEDAKVFGEAYWHRTHQISGYIICSKHGVFIEDSNIPVKSINKHEFYTASDENCIVKASQYKACNTDKYLKIAKVIEWIINSNLSSKEINWFYKQYKVALIAKALCSVTGRVYQEELIKDFSNFYCEGILKGLQSELSGENSNWLSSITRKPRKAFHPIRHILLMNYLSENIESFFKEVHSYEPFGKGPWFCLNRASEHYHRKIINDLKITFDSDSKQPVGTFRCSCGFIYSRKGPDKDISDCYRYGRIKEFGEIWVQKLKELLKDKTLSLREVSRRLNVDVKTVKKQSKKWCNYNNSEKAIIKSISHKIDINNNSQKYELVYYNRKLWLEMQISNPEYSKTELREMNKKVYIWLYRHDKEWLDSNSPGNNKTINVNTRVDWGVRDEEILKEAKVIVKEIINSKDKPERITISRISKRLGIAALIEKHLNRLPITKEYLMAVVEDIEAYQIRRVKWAAEQLNSTGKELKEWRLYRLAALKSTCSDKVKEVINEQIIRYGLR